MVKRFFDASDKTAPLVSLDVGGNAFRALAVALDDYICRFWRVAERERPMMRRLLALHLGFFKSHAILIAGLTLPPQQLKQLRSKLGANVWIDAFAYTLGRVAWEALSVHPFYAPLVIQNTGDPLMALRHWLTYPTLLVLAATVAALKLPLNIYDCPLHQTLPRMWYGESLNTLSATLRLLAPDHFVPWHLTSSTWGMITLNSDLWIEDAQLMNWANSLRPHWRTLQQQWVTQAQHLLARYHTTYQHLKARELNEAEWLALYCAYRYDSGVHALNEICMQALKTRYHLQQKETQTPSLCDLMIQSLATHALFDQTMMFQPERMSFQKG